MRIALDHTATSSGGGGGGAVDRYFFRHAVYTRDLYMALSFKVIA